MTSISDFAERVLFGTTLEEKLDGPGPLSGAVDRIRDSTVRSIATPGRPEGLFMQKGPGAARPPSDSNLENESARGQPLHFLANHELLATELMALVLLKFPDAPHAFRQGVLVTLQEEQEHTRLYLKRMKECGVEFGSFPLSGHFWRVVEPMQSPMDFVSRLSLTFEQANLDYSLHYANVFHQIGDEDTSAILRQIYEDEIGHVSHGLKWFREWKDPDQSDWEAFKSRLDFPMSPQRARGPSDAFNREGRLKAGLSDDFVDAIELYRQSRGRTPTVRWFDPGAEASLAGELSAADRTLLHQLMCDLEGLQICLSKQDDVVLVRRMPTVGFLRQLLNAGFDLPELVVFEDRETLADRKLSELSPWAWTPANHAIADIMVPATRTEPPTWRPDNVDLFRKSWATMRLQEWIHNSDNPKSFAGPECVGIPVHSVAEIEEAVARLSRRGFEFALFKADLGTAGRGQRRIACVSPLLQDDRRWLESIVRRSHEDGPLGVIEPELDRVLDLSFLWHLSHGAESPTFLGWTRQIVTQGRRYAGTRLGRPFADCNKDLSRFVLGEKCACLHAVREWLEPRIACALHERDFHGYFGIDAFVFRDASIGLTIKPLVELNPRVTMGHVALSLEQRLVPGVSAEFRILTRAEWDAMRHDLTNSPVEISNGRMRRGCLMLGEVGEHTKLIPVLRIGDL